MGVKPHILRLGHASRPSRNDADALADLHTRSRQVAYRGLYGDAYLDHALSDVSRASWRARFEDFDPVRDLILAAMEDGGPIGLAPVGLAYASFRLKPEVGALLDNLHVAPERKGGGLGRALLAETARWLSRTTPAPRCTWKSMRRTRRRSASISAWAASRPRDTPKRFPADAWSRSCGSDGKTP